MNEYFHIRGGAIETIDDKTPENGKNNVLTHLHKFIMESLKLTDEEKIILKCIAKKQKLFDLHKYNYDEYKVCTMCGEVKHVTEFYKTQKGRRPECKDCFQERRRMNSNETSEQFTF